MDPTDIADVTGYTFLMNGLAPGENFRAGFKQDDVRKSRVVLHALPHMNRRRLGSAHHNAEAAPLPAVTFWFRVGDK